VLHLVAGDCLLCRPACLVPAGGVPLRHPLRGGLGAQDGQVWGVGGLKGLCWVRWFGAGWGWGNGETWRQQWGRWGGSGVGGGWLGFSIVLWAQGSSSMHTDLGKEPWVGWLGLGGGGWGGGGRGGRVGLGGLGGCMQPYDLQPHVCVAEGLTGAIGRTACQAPV
jgi:hypothetical protein